jgi:hypothetical protein
LGQKANQSNPTHHCVQQLIPCPLLLLLCTCSSFSCRYTVVVSWFAQCSPLLYIKNTVCCQSIHPSINRWIDQSDWAVVLVVCWRVWTFLYVYSFSFVDKKQGCKFHIQYFVMDGKTDKTKTTCLPHKDRGT